MAQSKFKDDFSLMNLWHYTYWTYIIGLVHAATYDAWINGRAFSWIDLS